MLTHPITDVRAWTGQSIDAPANWYYPVPEVDLCASPYEIPQPFTAYQPPAAELAVIAKAVEPVREALTKGRGFAIVEAPMSYAHLPYLDWYAQVPYLYQYVGRALGQPIAQDVQGTVFYDVRDTGQDLSKGARFSVTNYESSFHTDNSFGTEIADYVGLLCLKSAKLGGTSQLLSGYALHNVLLAKHPDILATLYQPFHTDRRGGVNEGDSPTIQFPVIASNGAELLFRYLRYWIEVGHEKARQPLTAAQTRALNLLDECIRSPGLRVEFDLKPGQMFFVNNRWILHNRTAFEDHPEPERRRHLVRLWLQDV